MAAKWQATLSCFNCPGLRQKIAGRGRHADAPPRNSSGSTSHAALDAFWAIAAGKPAHVALLGLAYRMRIGLLIADVAVRRATANNTAHDHRLKPARAIIRSARIRIYRHICRRWNRPKCRHCGSNQKPGLHNIPHGWFILIVQKAKSLCPKGQMIWHPILHPTRKQSPDKPFLRLFGSEACFIGQDTFKFAPFPN